MSEFLSPRIPIGFISEVDQGIDTTIDSMQENMKRISLANNLPDLEGPEAQDAINALRERASLLPHFAITEAFVAPDSREFYDAKTGLQVEPSFIHGTRSHEPRTFDLRFTIPAPEGTDPLPATAGWLAIHFGQEAADNFVADAERERGLHYFNGYTGPPQMEVVGPKSQKATAFQPIGKNLGVHMRGLPSSSTGASLLAGTVHYNTYNGPPEDHGIHGRLLTLDDRQLAMFAGVLDRAVGKLVKINDL
jgi:hypothetical protein